MLHPYVSAKHHRNQCTSKSHVTPVGGIQQKIRAAYDAGLKEVLLPQDNLSEGLNLPRSILDHIRLTPVQTVEEVLAHALISSIVI